MTNSEVIIERLQKALQLHFANRAYFAVTYGSYASGCQTSASDIDFFVAVEQSQKEDLDALVLLLKDLEQEYAITLDTEVPYENKLLVSFIDLDHAVALDAFALDGTSAVVPSIQKEKTFLSSPQIRWRLILNALTTPHIMIAGNSDIYQRYRLSAEAAVRDLSKLLTGNTELLEERVRALITSKDGATGEMFLGYKSERLPIVGYLRNILKDVS